MPIDVDAALTTILTYFVHSTLLFAAAWLLTGTVFRHRPGVSEVLWRVALIGALVTTALHATGQWPNVSAPVWSLPPVMEIPSAQSEPIAATSSIPRTTGIAALTPAGSPWREALLLATTFLCGFAVLTFCGSCLRVRRILRKRELVDDPHMTAMLHELKQLAGLKRPLQLTRSHTIASPIALGRPFLGIPLFVRRRGEVVIPVGIEDRLSKDALRGVLAHEVAHHLWRDPFWRVIDRAVVAIGFIQPLHRIAARQLAELSEFRCDAWAVEATGSPESFADGLATVAAWLSGFPAADRRPIATVAAMAVRPSTLARRIDHVLDRPTGRRTRLRPIALACSMLLAPALAPAMPRFGTSDESELGLPHRTDTVGTPSGETESVEAALEWIGRELLVIDHDLARLRGVPNDPALVALRRSLGAKRDELASRRDSLAHVMHAPRSKKPGIADLQGPDDHDASNGPDTRRSR